jgi:hypothetical protein
MKEQYKIIKNFIDQATCNMLVDKLDNCLKEGYVFPPDNQCPNSPAFYGMFNDESIGWLSIIEEAVGKSLSPTYTYARIYQQGEILLPHTDKSECEYSFTLALKYDKEIWPFYLNTAEGTKQVLLYKGVENLHWRMPLENTFHYQAFFHYVDNAGPYADRKFDGRFEFATTQEVKDEMDRRSNAVT